MAAIVLTWLLRLAGSVLGLAALAACLPAGVMAGVNASLGLAALPDVPLTFYLARSTSLLYALHGAVHLLASTDLVRYRPVIVLLGAGNAAFGAAMLAVDLTSGMPWWWTAAEGPGIIAAGLLVLGLLRRVPAGPGATSAATRGGRPAPSPGPATS